MLINCFQKKVKESISPSVATPGGVGGGNTGWISGSTTSGVVYTIGVGTGSTATITG